MTHIQARKITLYFALLTASAFSADAADIRLKPQAKCPGPLVTLGDVARVTHSDPERAQAIADIVLFPVPAGTQTIHRNEIAEFLRLHAVDRDQWKLSGARQVVVYPLAKTVDFSERETAEQPDLTATEQAVIAVRALRRGEVIRASDVRLEPISVPSQAGDLVYRVEDAVGKEATQSIAVGKPIDRRQVRMPLLVRRNEVVTVYARGPGVRIRTTVRALEDGSHGELVRVQSLENKEQYTARVVEFQTVEVFASGPSVPRPSRRPSPWTVNR